MSDVIEIDDETENTFDDHINDQASNQIDAVENDSENNDTNESEAKEEYGKKIQKRIDKLVYERNTERQQREELAAELERERQRREELEQKVNQRSDEQLKDEIAQRLSKKAELMEIGEYESAAQIDEEIIDLKLQQQQKKSRTEENREQQPKPQQQSVTRSEAEQKWLDNNDWFFNPAKGELKDKAVGIYLALKDEGYDPSDEDTYIELDRRLNTKRQAPPPGPGPDRGNAVGDARSVKFTTADSAKMRQWGLDPNDPAARKEYLLNKKV